VTKLDITSVPRELDELIGSSSNSRHRQIMEVVRRHYLLGMTGRMGELFAPDMMVENPIYYFNSAGSSRTLRGQAEIMAFYKEQEGVVRACDGAVHAVTDAGYWAECWLNIYLPAIVVGQEGAGWCLKREWIAMHWPFDERARLIGEHVYEHVDVGEVVQIDPSDVITYLEARALLDPLIRPLPTYSDR
jgi:hypothetical protein